MEFDPKFAGFQIKGETLRNSSSYLKHAVRDCVKTLNSVNFIRSNAIFRFINLWEVCSQEDGFAQGNHREARPKVLQYFASTFRTP